jgi:hypothetical protein
MEARNPWFALGVLYDSVVDIIIDEMFDSCER